MVEFHEESEPELEIPAFLRKQAEDGNIKIEDRLRKHLFDVPNKPDEPRKKVFPSRVTGRKVLTVPEVEVPEFLLGSEQANADRESNRDDDTMPRPIW